MIPGESGAAATQGAPRTALLSDDLSKDEQDDLQVARSFYTQKHKKYETEIKASATLAEDIFGSIDPNFLPQLRKIKTPYQLLLTCKKKYKPSRQVAEIDILKQWEQLFKAPNVANTEGWIMI